jgi:ferredoxin
MRVTVDQDRCEGNARCVFAAPEVFALEDDDKAHLLIEQPGEELRAKVERAVRLCPRQAITIEEA